MKPLSVSGLNRYQRCPQLYAHTLTHEEPGSPATEFGKHFHAALEQYLLPPQATPGALSGALSRDVARGLNYLSCLPDTFTRSELRVLIAGYATRWDDDGLTVTATEIPFPPGTSIGPYAIAGRIDAVATDARGRVWLVEHKTASGDISDGSAYWLRLRLDLQCTFYLVAARKLGLKPAGVIYDVTSRASLTPRVATPIEARRYRADGELYANQREHDESTAEFEERALASVGKNPEVYYRRQQVVRLERELERGIAEIVEMGRAIESTRQWVRNPGSCFAYRRQCHFFDVCTGATTLETGNYERRS